MHISPATLADIPALCDLLAVLFSQEADFEPNYEAQHRGLTRIISNPDIGCILIARREGQILGMINLLYTLSTALGEPVALLEDLVVLPQVRGNGVGSGLLKQAIETARLQGCKRITLLTDRDNESAQRFYQRQGFATSAMIPMRLLLT